jgi:methyl-accepting chemotaxis protein
VINEQLPHDYDIFIGILWTRFGTPTGRAGSGTEEEFNSAYSRYKESPEAVRIMFYFSQERFFPKSQSDLTQLGLVLAFKAKLGEQGVLYADYPNASEFGSVLRLHLTRQIQSWMAVDAPPGKDRPAEHAPPTTSAPSPEPVAEDAEGIMDLTEVVLERIGVSLAALTAIQELQQELNDAMSLTTEQVSKLSNPGLTPDQKEVKRVVNSAAEAMNKFADGVTSKTKEMGEAYREAADAMSRAIPLSTDFGSRGRAELSSLLESLTSLKGTLSGVSGNIKDFRAVIERAPRATTALNRARRQTIDALDGFANETLSIVQLTETMERTADETLRNWPDEADQGG